MRTAEQKAKQLAAQKVRRKLPDWPEKQREYSASQWARNIKKMDCDPLLKGEHLEYRRSLLKADLISYFYNSIKSNSAKRGLEFTIDKSDIIIPKHCPHCGVVLKSYLGKKIRGNDGISIDRKDSSKGYIKGNIIVVCWRANSLKKDATLDEMKQLVAWMETL